MTATVLFVFGGLVFLIGATLVFVWMTSRGRALSRNRHSLEQVAQPAREMLRQAPRTGAHEDVARRLIEQVAKRLDVEAVISQAKFLSYGPAHEPAGPRFTAALLEVVHAAAPGVLAQPQNKDSIATLVREALGDQATIIWPSEKSGQPFNSDEHRAFPMPGQSQHATITKLLRCGFVAGPVSAPALVEVSLAN